MQLILSAIVSVYLGLASLVLPNTVVPKNQKPHDHPVEHILITEYELLPGTIFGYCGAWAVAVADRFLGNKSGEPTMAEWTKVSEELGVDRLSGGVMIQDLVDYYTRRDFEITFAELRKNSCDPQYYAAKQLDKQCVVMLLMFPTEDVGLGGHVETVLGVEQCVVHTNSWGTDASVTMKGRYLHSNMTVYNDVNMEAYFLIACQED